MLYFLQKIRLKNHSGEYVFIREDDQYLHFKKEGKEVIFSKERFPKNDIIEVWETVKLFGRTPIWRLARAI